MKTKVKLGDTVYRIFRNYPYNVLIGKGLEKKNKSKMLYLV